jgi:hypothetical protein
MPRFRLRSDCSPVALFFPQGHHDSLYVEPGDVIDVPGDVVADSPDDAFVIGTGDEARAWPKALWESADASPVADAAPSEPPTAEAAPPAEGN